MVGIPEREAWILRRQTCRGVKRADHWSIYWWGLFHDPQQPSSHPRQPNQPLGPKPPLYLPPQAFQPGTPPILEDFPTKHSGFTSSEQSHLTYFPGPFLAAHTYHPLPPLLSTTVRPPCPCLEIQACPHQ